jgi:hypothetical protein
VIGAALLVLVATKAPDAPLTEIDVDGDVKLEIVVGRERGVDAPPAGLTVTGPLDGRVMVVAPQHAEGPRATQRVRADGRTLRVVARLGAQVVLRGDRLDALALEAAHTSRIDAAQVAARALDIKASQAARVRARGDVVTVHADQSAQVVLAGKPGRLSQDVRDAARVTVEP